MKAAAKKKGKAGRPSKAEGPRVPYTELDNLLVHGEIVEREGGARAVEFPSYRELADRYGVAASVVAEYAKRRNVQERRKVARDRVENRVEEKLVELRAQAIAVTRDDQIRMVDRYLLECSKAIEEGRMRADTVTDMNTAMRLKEYLQGGADSRSEVNVSVSLEVLQGRHREATRRVEALDPEQTGEVAPPALRASLGHVLPEITDAQLLDDMSAPPSEAHDVMAEPATVDGSSAPPPQQSVLDHESSQH